MTVQPSSKTAAYQAYDYLETTGNTDNSSWLDKAKQWLINNYKKYFSVVTEWTVFLNNAISLLQKLRRK